MESFKNLEGETLSGRYAVERRLGSGSMGDVYLAEHTLMKKKVALKVLHPEFLNNDEAVKRFQREAQAAAHIDHHNVCSATDFGETEEGYFFLVMEYLEGRTLGDLIGVVEELSAARAVHVARQIASGLVRAHALEIVHRDLKPDNIMIVEREEDPDFVKIMDFGVAHVYVGDDEKLTRAGTTYGTPAYMSPEQSMGRQVDGRSDLYSLGIILYEMLTGAVPFFATSVAVVMSAQAEEPVPPMAEKAPDVEVPEDLERIVMKLLSKDPAERFQTADELDAALASWERGETEDDETLQPIPRRKEPIGAITSGPYAALSTGGHATIPDPERAVGAGALDTIVDANEPGSSEAGSAAPPWEPIRRVVAEAPLPVRLGMIAGVLAVLLLPIAVGLGIARTWEDAADVAESIGEPETLEAQQQAFLEKEAVAQAMAKLTTEPEVAAAALAEIATAQPENPHAAFWAGKAAFEAGDTPAAVGFYGKAIELDGRYRSDPAILDDAFDRFPSKEKAERQAARDFVEETLLETEAGREGLAAMAAEGPNYRVRHDARKMLERTGAKEKLPRWRQVTVELRSTDDCGRLKKGVEELGEIGNPAGLPAVERIHRLPRKGCGFLKRGDCYECLRGTVRKVKKQLESAPAAAENDAGVSAKK